MALVSLKGHDEAISETTKRQKTRTINQENLTAVSRIKNLVRETGKVTGKKKKKVGCFPSDCLPWIPLLESPNNQLKKKCAFPCGSAGQCLAENGILYGQPKHSPDISLSPHSSVPLNFYATSLEFTIFSFGIPKYLSSF